MDQSPSTPEPTDPAGPPPTGAGRPGLRLAVGGAIVALGAVLAALVVLGPSSTPSGAETPEAAIHALVDAIEAGDLDAATDALVPGERDVVRAVLHDLVTELARVDLLADDLDLGALPGLDVEVVDRSSSTTSLADDLALVRTTGTLRTTVSGRHLPVGSALTTLTNALGVVLDDVPSPPPSPLDLAIATHRQGDRWYVSIGYTLAELQRAETGWPFPDPRRTLAPRGAGSPEAAVEALVEAARDLDVAALMAQLNPGEAAAIHRYAPNLLDGSASWFVEDGAALDVADLEHRIERGDDWADVHIERLTLVVTTHGPRPITTTVRYADGCTNVLGSDPETGPSGSSPDHRVEPHLPPGFTLEEDGSITVCPEERPGLFAMGLLGGGSATPPTIGLVRHDGQWYLSPTRTVAAQLLDALRRIPDGEGASLLRDVITPFG